MSSHTRRTTGRTTGRTTRQRPIRVLLALIFVVPLVSLLALWGFAASVTVSAAVQEHNFTAEDNLYGGAAQALATQLAEDRLQAFIWLSTGRRSSETPMLNQFRATDDTAAAFVKGVHTSPSMIASTSWTALQSFEYQLRGLSALHSRIEAGSLTALGAFQSYNTLVDSLFGVFSELVVVNNTSLYMQAAASIEAGRALEMADRELTLISGALESGGNMTKPERLLFAQYVANQRFLMADALKNLAPALGSGYAKAESSTYQQSFAAIENKIVDSIGAKGPLPINALAFAGAVIPLFKEYQSAEKQDRLALSSRGTQVGNRLLLEVFLAGGLGLLAVLLSIFLMVRFGRRIGRELTGLQGAALELAEHRLPRVVERLSQGEDVDVAAEAAPLEPGRIGEIAKVTEAFSSVQRTAVEAAVGQARLRRGVSQVFRNLAWRSQSLLHRQLSLLDAMERKTSEPETLAELFQLDHLTTRMRRHAEGLIILSGATPGRGWRTPVPVIDVLRGALAEVEDYTRVNVVTESEDTVIGAAVADVIHLIAELIENATTFSPPGTEVTVKAGRVAKGLAVEIEDRGVGISDHELAKANDRILNPPEFDLAETDQLGLFVVARLAAKHLVKVTLRQSPFGGTTAIVLLPHSIMVSASKVEIESDSSALGADVWRITPRETRRELRRDMPLTAVPAAPGIPAGTAASAEPAVFAAAAPSDDSEDSEDSEDSVVTAVSAVRDSSGRANDLEQTIRRAVSPLTGDNDPWAAPSTWSFAPADRSDTAGAMSGTQPSLPRRVRQANLAPQLKNASPEPAAPLSEAAQSSWAESLAAHSLDRMSRDSIFDRPRTDSVRANGSPSEGAQSPAGEVPPRADDWNRPEESRALGDSLQFGWQRARAEGELDDNWPDGNGSEHATMPEDREGL